MNRKTEAIRTIDHDIRNRTRAFDNAVRRYVRDNDIDIDERFETFVESRRGVVQGLHSVPCVQTIRGGSTTNNLLLTRFNDVARQLVLASSADVPVSLAISILERHLISLTFDGNPSPGITRVTIDENFINTFKRQVMERFLKGFHLRR